MGSKREHSTNVWALVRAQHGVITRAQLLDLGYSSKSIEHRVSTGRLHPLHRGVYAVGRPRLGQKGTWMAAVLSCGPGAALSHHTAAALLGRREQRSGPIQVSVPNGTHRKRPGIVLHRRAGVGITDRHGIPVTPPIDVLIDLATMLTRDDLEAAISEADKLDLVDPETLRAALDDTPARPGLGTLKTTLDRRMFTLSDSKLERLFLPIVERVGLPRPVTRTYVNGFRVDFPGTRELVHERRHGGPGQGRCGARGRSGWRPDGGTGSR